MNKEKLFPELYRIREDYCDLPKQHWCSWVIVAVVVVVCPFVLFT